MKVKTILVSQPEPKMENSPYQSLVDRTKVKIDFRSFIGSGKQIGFVFVLFDQWHQLQNHLP